MVQALVIPEQLLCETAARRAARAAAAI